MIIGQVNNWYRPYYVLVNSKWYKVDKIKFYKDNAIMVETQSGWLERVDGDIKEIELPIDKIKLKRKETFDGKVFIISKGKEWCSNETIADLYIPADMLNIHFAKHEIKYQQLRAVYEGEQDIYISTYVKSLTVELEAIRDEYEKVYKQLDSYNMKVKNADIVYENINKLKELAEKYKAEQKRVHDLTVEDVVGKIMNKISANSNKVRFIFSSNAMANSSCDVDDMFDMGMVENSSCNNDCANCMMECPYKEY